MTKVLSDCDPTWPAEFEAAARDLLRATGAKWAIAHIGSTSSPGMPAKSIIDLAVRVEKVGDVDLNDRALHERGLRRNCKEGSCGRGDRKSGHTGETATMQSIVDRARRARGLASVDVWDK